MHTDGNSIDEGTDAEVYSCDIIHTISSSNDARYANSPPGTVKVSIINDDEADIKLWSINPTTNKYDYEVKFLPFFSNEGGTVEYGIRLDTEPQFAILVRPNITLDNAANIVSPPSLVPGAEVYVFDATNWNVSQRAQLHSTQDDIPPKLVL